jgi:hypothetical protein
MQLYCSEGSNHVTCNARHRGHWCVDRWCRYHCFGVPPTPEGAQDFERARHKYLQDKQQQEQQQEQQPPPPPPQQQQQQQQQQEQDAAPGGQQLPDPMLLDEDQYEELSQEEMLQHAEEVYGSPGPPSPAQQMGAASEQGQDSLAQNVPGTQDSGRDGAADAAARQALRDLLFKRLPGLDGATARRRFQKRGYTWYQNGARRESLKKLFLNIEQIKACFQ